MRKSLATREQLHVIKVITFGNILEWFDVYSFGYLAHSISRNFFPFLNGAESLLFAFLVFGLGFVSRILGGLYFGKLGDHVGRKQAYILSITLLSIPTFLMGVLPVYKTIGFFAPILLCILRFCQAFPTGGEIAGTICFLIENADQENKRFLTSWNAVGNQIGALVAILEIFIMENSMTVDLLDKWGWRISFITGGFIGLFGLYLRHALHETPVFNKLKKEHKIDRETLRELFSKYIKRFILGTGFGLVDASTFYLIATYIPIVLGSYLGLSTDQNILVSFIILSITTILLPIFGYLGDRMSNRKLLSISAIVIILLLYPFSVAISTKSIASLITIGFFFLISVSCITALVAFQIGSLFPSKIRFTGTGISVNLADGFFGGLTPAISLILLQITGVQWAFIWYILFCATISLFCYIFGIKD